MINTNVSTAATVAFFNAAYPDQPSVARVLFPFRRKTSLELSMLKGTRGVIPSLAPSAFDVKSTLRSRGQIELTKTQMPYFKEGIPFTEEDQMQVNLYGENMREEVLRRFYDDASTLIRAADIVSERMAFQLLFPADGLPKISFVENGATYAYTYGDAAWTSGHFTQLTGNDFWTATTTADPMKNINTVCQNLRAHYGSRIRYLIMNSITFGLMASTDAMKARFTNRSLNFALTDRDVRDVVRNDAGLEIVLVDEVYVESDGTTNKYVPDGYVAFVPEGALGATYRAVTPAEARLRGNSNADVTITENGIAVSREVLGDPVLETVIVSQIVLPTYERMDEVGLMKVIA